MPLVEQDAAIHQARFVAMLNAEFEKFGLPHGLPPALQKAVQATPRHRFVHRFRIGDGPLLDFDADPGQHLATVYSDQIMRHVDADGAPLPSSNSQPSYVLWLLHLLDLRSGQRVLEIGSGSGWLAAVMAQVAGPTGHVTGIEIIPELAAQSRTDLNALGQENVTILTQDGTAGHAAGAPFDRVMITAATWDLPSALFDQVAEGGCVLVPIELRGTSSCQVTLLRRLGDHFVAERAIIGWFVPLIGAGQRRTGVTRALDSLPFWAEIAAAPAVQLKLALGAAPGGGAGSIASEFKAFLGRTEPEFAVFSNTDASPAAFGVIDDTAQSVALLCAGELVGYGGSTALRRLARAFARWTEFGLPGMGAYNLEVFHAATAPEATDRSWVERRDQTALLWTLPTDARAWRSLLEDVPATPSHA